MAEKEIDFGTQVICTKLRELPVSMDKDANTALFNLITCQYREVGHIGIVSGVFPAYNVVYVTHQEYKDGDLMEFITAYFEDEIEVFEPPTLIEDTPLAKAIKLIQITRE